MIHLTGGEVLVVLIFTGKDPGVKMRDMCLLIRLLPLISLGKISHLQDYAVFNAAQTVRDCSLDWLKGECIDTTASDNY